MTKAARRAVNFRVINFVVVVVLLVATGVAAAGASPKIVEPSANPVVVQPAAGGKLQPFTIRVSGFQPGEQVYIEQCDGVAITDPHWTPTVDCDIGTSPAPVFTPSSGIVVFGKDDLNHRLVPFRGSSPQGEFSCFGATAQKGNPNFGTCKIRISTNNTQPTKDQLFLELVLAGHAGSSGSSSGSGSGSSSSGATIALIVVGVAVVLLLVGFATFRSRRRRAAGT